MATMLFKHWILKMYLMRGTHTLNTDFGFIAQKNLQESRLWAVSVNEVCLQVSCI